jgi:hypothetical protein
MGKGRRFRQTNQAPIPFLPKPSQGSRAIVGKKVVKQFLRTGSRGKNYPCPLTSSSQLPGQVKEFFPVPAQGLHLAYI